MTVKHKTWCLLGLTFGPPILVVLLTALFVYANTDTLPVTKLDLKWMRHALFD